MSARDYIPHLIAALLLLAMAMSMDYQDQVAAESERVARANHAK